MTLDEILRQSASHHARLCPRQVLGARMSLYAGDLLGLDLPRRDKRLLVIAETDGCFVDGLIAATGCHVGGRTLRLLDFGKVAATFVNVLTDDAIRLSPRREIRSFALDHAPAARNRWEAMLTGYQALTLESLFHVQPVCLNTPVAEIISNPGRKAECAICGEEIFNGREVNQNGLAVCRPCAGEGYFEGMEIEDSLREKNLDCYRRKAYNPAIRSSKQLPL